jgi:hypothetical protein
LRKIITVYSKNYAKFIFFEQEEELIKVKKVAQISKTVLKKLMYVFFIKLKIE